VKRTAVANSNPSAESPRSPDALVWAYEAAVRAGDRLYVIGHALFAGVALGLLDRQHLDAIDERFFADSWQYRNDHYNLAGLIPAEIDCLRLFPQSGRLLVTAAGGGREVVALARRGYEVDGCECNPVLTAAANALITREGIAGVVHPCPRNDLVAPNAPYDGVLVGLTSYMHIPGRQVRIAFLRRALEVAKPGAPVMLTFQVRTGRGRALQITRIVANVFRRAARRAPIELGDTMVGGFWHQFARSEIEAELQEAGAELLYYATDGFGRAVCRRMSDPARPGP
jgi:hypothetical protein